MKYFGRAARMEPCKRIGTGCTIYALPVSKILNKEIRVLQCESLGAGISFPRLGRRGYAPQRNVARPRRTQRKLQHISKAEIWYRCLPAQIKRCTYELNSPLNNNRSAVVIYLMHSF